MHNGPTIASWRLAVTYAAMFALSIGYGARLYQLQIVEGASYREQADENRFTLVNIPAPRGVIYDRNGFQLVRNIPSYNVVITPAFLPDSPAEVEAIFQRLSALTGVPVDQEGPPAARCVPGRGIRQIVEVGVSFAPFDAWPVACDVDETVARVLRQQQVDMPGVGIETEPIRDYTTGVLSAAVIGYLGPIPASLEQQYRGLGFVSGRDRVGYAGIEWQYQSVLAGKNGIKTVVEDVAGQPLFEVGTIQQPTPGNSLRLTLDTRLQAAAAAALSSRIDFLNRFAGETRVPLGVVIAMDPRTGEILAMVTLPSYENNRIARVIPADYFAQLEADERGLPLINHAIGSEFPPGSTFKMATAVGVLVEDVVTPRQIIQDPGVITIEDRYFPNDPGRAKDFVCWKRDGHGRVDFLTGIAVSCNIYFYKIGGGYPGEVERGLGVDGIGLFARALGYGAPLGIDLPAEEDGLIPDEDWKRINLGESWATGDTYNMTTGQGFVLATPLQVLTSISTLANGGRVMWPHMVGEILDGEGNVIERVEPCVLWDLADGVITPLERIGAGCPRVPASVRESRIRFPGGTPDLLVDPSIIDLVREGMRRVVTEGTAAGYADLENISSGGKTGTGEFCDRVALERNLCEPGNWPTHAWYVGFAPWENPEIAVVAFLYNAGEGAVAAGPVVRQVLEAYFQLKAVETVAQP